MPQVAIHGAESQTSDNGVTVIELFGAEKTVVATITVTPATPEIGYLKVMMDGEFTVVGTIPIDEMRAMLIAAVNGEKNLPPLAIQRLN